MADPADPSNLEQTCLNVVSSGVFAELDSGSYANFPQKDCFAQNQVPFFGAYLMTTGEENQFYPYLFDFNTVDSLYHNTVFALRDRGFFRPSSGFKKLGFVYNDCYPKVISEEMGWLQQAGLSSSQLVTYDEGCPQPFDPVSGLQEAVLKFEQSGVTNVTTAEFVGDFANFTTIAERQGFRPRYGLPDDSLVAISGGNQHPDFNNIANAITITASRDGEDKTPGMVPTAGTAKCNAIFQSHGLPSTYQQAPFAGNACDQVWMFAAAAGHAPALLPNALAAGLQASRSIDFSFPQGPNDFAGPQVTIGGQFWRTDQFMPSCECWRVIDPSFHPSYA
jgi:hypothetical protein